MWTASFFLGSFAGPTLSGFLVEHFGFRWSTFFFFLLNVVIFTVDLIELTMNVGRSRTKLIDNFQKCSQSEKKAFSDVKYSKLDQNSTDDLNISKLEKNSN